MTRFDLRSIVFAKHAQHVVLIHFPIALFVTGAVFDYAAQWTRRTALATVAYFNVIGAAVFVLPVLITGTLAWRWQLDGQRLHGTLLWHLLLGCASGLLVCVAAWTHFRSRQVHEPSATRLVLEGVTAALIAVTAHLGGVLSGVNTPG